ncbi:ATP-binding protein [Streptomyces sp. M41]|uniref:ATP-binding protein n=1 Tax=Streptomyces sp. M41 TaxID=3059412 RepID=UPI00374D20AD
MITNVMMRRQREECTRLRITAPNAGPASVHNLRHRLEVALNAWGLESLTDTAGLLASEVLGNAVEHARGTGHEDSAPTLRLTVSLTCGKLLIEVGDPDEHLPCMRQAASDDENGRGMALLQALADKWGAEPMQGGKKVWFTLRLPG